jgi:hypothetical protein
LRSARPDAGVDKCDAAVFDEVLLRMSIGPFAKAAISTGAADRGDICLAVCRNGMFG